jgi:AcrR family transcriptional regulator
MTDLSSVPERSDLPVPETERGRRTRARLLAAAESVFGDVGYERASVMAITRTADVAQGTFYKYFPSKHSIFVELVIDFGVTMRRHVSQATSALVDVPRGELERVGLACFFEFALQHPGLYAVVREAQFVAPATYRWYYESFVAAYRDNFGPTASDVDVETIAWIIAGTADMLGLRWVVWEGRMPPPSVLEQARDLFELGFGGMLER